METSIEHETLNDTNYKNNYDEIFENNSPKLDRQILSINKLGIYSDSKSLSKTDYGNEIDKLFQDRGFVNSTSFY